MTTDYNTGSYIDGKSYVYYGDSNTAVDLDYYRVWDNPYNYSRREPSPVTVIVEAPAPEQTNRKENNMAINRQTFLDALTDEGKSVSSEGREIVKEAKADKWELFLARLLARAFESADLAMLKEKPKEVLVTTKEK